MLRARLATFFAVFLWLSFFREVFCTPAAAVVPLADSVSRCLRLDLLLRASLLLLRSSPWRALPMPTSSAWGRRMTVPPVTEPGVPFATAFA